MAILVDENTKVICKGFSVLRMPVCVYRSLPLAVRANSQGAL